MTTKLDIVTIFVFRTVILPKPENVLGITYPGLETNARPRLVRFRPGEWFIPPDQPGGRVDLFFIFLGLPLLLENSFLFEDINVLGLFTGRQ